jgi:formyl-CoA transferase
VERVTMTREGSHWLEQLEAAEIPCGPVNSYAEVFTDPHVLAREMLTEVDHPVAGRVRMTGFNVKLTETPSTMRLPAPTLGQHTRQVLHSLGYQDEVIDELKTTGVI